MREIHPLIFGVFAALLLFPTFFWVGGKLLNMRVDGWPALAAMAGVGAAYFFLKK